MTEITGKILENALCFIYESVKRMDRLEKNQSLTEANQNLKYAICHLFSGTSLLLKARLSKEHWSFIFEDINEATEKKLNSGDFQGIKLKSCQNRLSNICSIELDEKQKNVLETLRKKRNEAEHFFIIERESVWKSRLSEVLVLILDFKEKYLKECLIKDEEIKKRIDDYTEKIRSKSFEFKEFVEARLKSIQSELKNRRKREPDKFMRFPFPCQECFQEAVVYGENHDFLECLFCDHKIDPECYADYLFELSNRRLGEVECIECGACGEENGIVPAR